MHDIKLLPAAYQVSFQCCRSEAVQQAVPQERDFEYLDIVRLKRFRPLIFRADSNDPVAVILLENHSIQDSLI
jgi:hypothetical protein